MKTTLLVVGLLLSTIVLADEASFGMETVDETLIESAKEEYPFQAEINKLMDLIVNSLYSNPEIFLRELISNAADALDKLRFLSLTDKSLIRDVNDFEIRIKADSENGLLHIRDTGIGMSHEDLINKLGNIAKSGTKEFIEKFATASDVNMIGQFGVGFYSAFLVSDVVTVVTKHPEDDKQYIWQSSAESMESYTITEDPRGNTLGRGTLVSLKLKKDALPFLQQDVLEQLVATYSEFINFPIYLWASHTETEEVLIEEDVEDVETESELDGIDVSEEEEDEDDEEEDDLPKTETIEKDVWEWELLNKVKPIWTRSPKEVTEEEYIKFYQSIAQTTQEPLAYSHFVAEGEYRFTGLLYVPETPSQEYLMGSKLSDLKLYVKRVFITDKFDDIMPKYLGFVKGIVDSDDLPLNVGREILQKSKALTTIRKKMVRKAIAMFQELTEDEEKYAKFYESFQNNLKFGALEDQHNRFRLMNLLRFNTYKHRDTPISLQQYVDEMQEGQDKIYFLGGSSDEAVIKSPLIENAISLGYDIVILTLPLDEYLFRDVEKYDSKYNLINLGRETIDSALDPEDKKTLSDRFEPLTSILTEELKGKVNRVIISSRLTRSPCALVASSFGHTANMERVARAQLLGDPRANAMYSAQKVFELNPAHPIITRLLEMSEAGDSETVGSLGHMLYDTATVSSGFELEDPANFAKTVQNVIAATLGVESDMKVEESNFELEDNESLEDAHIPDETIDFDKEDL